jgi:hypothetical protein
MKILRSLTMLYLLAASDLLAHDNPTSPWINAVPVDFPSVEKLFGDAKCKFTFPNTYLYDTKKEHWLSYEEAATEIPELANILSSQKCDMRYPPEKLSSILNVQWPEEKGLVVLFFEPPHGMLEVFFKNGSPSRLKYEEQVQLLEQLNTLPRYRIFTPITGLKSQF